MEKVYYAKRISFLKNNYEAIELFDGITKEEIAVRYREKIHIEDRYIRNGHWVIKFPKDKNLSISLPRDLNQSDIWAMCKQKILDSDIFFGYISDKSYGTIVEAGYAAGLKKIPVYLLPEPELSDNIIKDLWFVFQIAKDTCEFYKNEHISMLKEFRKLNINSVQEYMVFLDSVKPTFLSKD